MKKSNKENVIIITFFERIGPRVQNEAEALKEAGYNVTVFNWNRGGPYRNLAENFGFEVERIELKAPEKGLKSYIFTPILYLLLLKRLAREKFEIIHCTHLALVPLCLLFKWKAKIVYDAKEMHTITLSKRFPRFSRPIRALAETLENIMIKQYDLVLTINSIENFLEKRYKKHNDNVKVLNNVPSLKNYNQEKVNEFRNKYQNKKVIVYIGQIQKANGSLQTLQALKKIDRKDFIMLFIGRFGDSKSEAIEFIEKHNLDNVVKFIEWLPSEEMFLRLKAADIALALYQPVGIRRFTSIGNSRKISTYMQASLPVIAPEFGEIGQVVKEEKCGMTVDTTKPKKIAEAILHLLDNPKVAKNMGENGRRAVLDKYNWRKEKRKLIRAYKSIKG